MSSAIFLAKFCDISSSSSSEEEDEEISPPEFCAKIPRGKVFKMPESPSSCVIDLTKDSDSEIDASEMTSPKSSLIDFKKEAEIIDLTNDDE